MILQPDGMAQSVVEIWAVSRFRDQIPCGLVDVAEAHAGPYDAFRLLIGPADQIVDGCVFFRRFFAEKGARHVGAVAVLHAAHVDHDAVPCLQTGVVRLVVRVSRIGAKRKDGVEALRAPLFFVESAHLVRTFLLRHSLFHKGCDLFHAGIVDPGGFPHFFLLICVLDGTHPVHAAGSVHIFRLGISFHQPQQKAGGPAFVDADGLLFAVCGDVRGHNACAVVRVGHPDFVQIHFRDHEQIVQKEAVLPIRAHIQGVETFIRLHPYAGQIPDA